MAGFLETAGIPKIQFLSASGFESGLALESNVFSIHAEGYVRQGKRETRVRIMAVVDYRKAPTVADLVAKVGEGGNPGDNPASAPGAEPTDGADSAEAAVGISGALVPSTAGRVVYFRVN
jgi:hypothetical protein